MAGEVRCVMRSAAGVAGGCLVPRIAAGVSCAVGAGVLTGWETNCALLKSLVPGLVAMNPLTAVLLVVSGFGLWLSCGAARPAASRALAGAAAAAAAVRLLAYAGGPNAGLDRLLFPARVAAEHPPNFMAPNTALCILLVAAALLLIDVRWGRTLRPSQLAAIAALMLSAQVLAGYLYSLAGLERVRGAIPMALHTALMFALLSVGILSARPDMGVMRVVTADMLAGIAARRMLVPAITLAPLLGWLALQGQRRGLYSSEVGLTLLVGAFVAVFAACVVCTAGRIQRVEAERARAEAEAIAARQEAERANAAKSEFLSRMSHELRTPLNAILGFGQLLQRRSLDPKAHAMVCEVLKGGRHLLGLIDEVLDIARVESGNLAISLEPVPLAAAVHDVLALLKASADGRDVRLEWDADAEFYVVADRQRLRQVLLNLVSNAIKYNSEGGAVTVTCEVRGDRTILCVEDTGSGIPADQMPRLFTPFERLGAERTAVEGTGLGLALCKTLLEAMGGSISLTSAQGKGTTAVIELGSAADPQAQYVRRSGDDGAAPARDVRPPRTVLYVEDNIPNIRLMERIVEERPELKLITAMQGSLAVELAKRARPDLILLDMHLPDMPGADVLARVKCDECTAPVPVVVISADATPRQSERAISAGASAYLTKPIQVEQVLRVLDELLYAA